jgi:hypothetical protein
MSLTLTLKRGGGDEISGSGTNIELEGTIAGGAIESVELKGDTQQQTYSGKNLFDKDKPLENQYIDASGNWVTGGGYSYVNQEIAATGGEKITLSFSQQVGSGYIRFAQYKSDGTFIQRGMFNTSPTTITLQANTAKVIWSVDNTDSLYFENLQIERGSTATSYEPYVGSTASPNPDYPQEVQTVTGEQTITVSDGNSQSQSYTVNLGSIELCKIGDYQDYIYKSGEDWYVHKEITKLTFVSADFDYDASIPRVYKDLSSYRLVLPTDQYAVAPIISNKFVAHSSDYVYSQKQDGFALSTSGFMSFVDTKWSSSSEALSDADGTIVFAALATPTDTQITDATLIGQLNALNAGETYDGTTVITVASENLASPLEVKASTSIAKTYTEVEIGSPFTISDVEGKSSTTTLNGNVYVDFAYSKKAFQVDIFNLSASDYSDIRDFYDYQFTSGKFITLSIPELSISNMPVYMEMSKRNIVSQCLTTDKLTLNFRETVQP